MPGPLGPTNHRIDGGTNRATVMAQSGRARSSCQLKSATDAVDGFTTGTGAILDADQATRSRTPLTFHQMEG
jgi:hypothetical protein